MPAPFALMGILNVTPGTPEDFAVAFDADAAVRRGMALIDAGATIIDVGAEATRTLQHDVPADVELRRVVPVIQGLADERPHATISVDTTKAEVARAALQAGATYVNDVSAMRSDLRMLETVAEHGASCCLMHMRGAARTMQGHARYDDVVEDVRWFLERRINHLVANGIPLERIDVDPGLGFSKTPQQDVELLRRLDEIASLGPRVVVGASHKSFVPSLTRRDDDQQRLGGAIATAVLALRAGARVIRAHDVGLVRDALALASYVVGPDEEMAVAPPRRTALGVSPD